ncbi:MAG: hypothetical protein M0P57_03415 [Syntrophales bacterium]|nr:hypothetical protein [Syntrophales bacterium]MDY0044248.1 hypothetical protein [Syntrophales bacterium]
MAPVNQIKKFALLLFVILIISFFGLNNHARTNETNNEFSSEVSAVYSQAHPLIEKINHLILYTIEGGEKHTRYFGRDELSSGGPLHINGYVNGAVLLSNDEVEAELDGTLMSRILENEDGTLACKYFGPLAEANFLYVEHSKNNGGNSTKGKPNYLFGGYSYFPRVLGSAVSGKNNFFISIKKDDAVLNIPIQHERSHTLFTFTSGSENKVVFNCQGNSLKESLNDLPDLAQRLESISDGINSVERAFGSKLVTRVHVVDYNIRNAVTCEGESEIWFYRRTFREETLDELKTIAEHETLHLLVDRHGFAKQTGVLEHYADLRGFDTLSYERFILITRGIVLRETADNQAENKIFFSFINERNFIKGRKGGHSHQNPDEFCTSFLHSLMYIENLEDNLNGPSTLESRTKPRYLAKEEKQKILYDYIKTIEVLKESISDHTASFGNLEKMSLLFENAYNIAKGKWKKSINLLAGN